jgi:hypothetical protein
MLVVLILTLISFAATAAAVSLNSTIDPIFQISTAEISIDGSIDPIIHIPTPGEGILSHFFQILRLRHTLQSMNRSGTIIETTFRSKSHYPDMEFVNICSAFVLPQGVTCTETPNDVIVDKFECVVASSGFAVHPKDYNLPPLSFANRTLGDIPLKKVKCYVGWVSHWEFHGRPYRAFNFTQKYTQLLPTLRTIITSPLSSATMNSSISSNGRFAAIHWRRGDQIPLKCKTRGDTSINCAANVSDFISVAKSVLSRKCPNISTTYVATNEEDPDSLKALRAAGFVVFSDLMRNLQDAEVLAHWGKVSSLDQFMIELMLLCDANVFFAWGNSHVHEIIRLFCSPPTKKRFFDNRLFEH